MLLAPLTMIALLSASQADSPPDIRSFRPSQHGFKFRNAFKGSPLPVSLGKLDNLLGVPNHYGLCGGMSAAAADFFLTSTPVPSDAQVPDKGTDLYDFIYSRQIDSLDTGLVQAAKFSDWMDAPDAGPLGTRARSLVAVAPTIRSTAAGRPVMLGLVLTSRRAKGKLWENHQVLAYDVRTAPGSLAAPLAWTISIYDPNFPSIDDARLEARLTIEDVVRIPPLPALPTVTRLTIPVMGLQTIRRATGKRDTPVRGFFIMPYTPALAAELPR